MKLKPLLKSKDGGPGFTVMMHNGFFLLAYVVIYLYFIIKSPIYLIQATIVFCVLILYTKFNLSNRFFRWEFYEDYFLKKSLIGINKKKYKYADITSWQIRRRFGTQSRNESIPNYTEMAFWIHHKVGLSFDDSDYSNFDEMRIFFEKKMQDIGIEMAEYRE